MKTYAEMSEEEREKLLATIMNPVWMNDEDVLKHPVATVKMIARCGDAECVMECLPYIREWEEKGERVTMRRVLKQMCLLYGVADIMPDLEKKLAEMEEKKRSGDNGCNS